MPFSSSSLSLHPAAALLFFFVLPFKPSKMPKSPKTYRCYHCPDTFFEYPGGLLHYYNRVHSAFQIECGVFHKKFKTVALRDEHRENEHRSSFVFFLSFFRQYDILEIFFFFSHFHNNIFLLWQLEEAAALLRAAAAAKVAVVAAAAAAVAKEKTKAKTKARLEEGNWSKVGCASLCVEMHSIYASHRNKINL